MSNNNIDQGDKSDESSSNVQASFSCDKCDETFDSLQELKEHTATAH
jgi:hypothetical protein